jgi:hypothetical protein
MEGQNEIMTYDAQGRLTYTEDHHSFVYTSGLNLVTREKVR